MQGEEGAQLSSKEMPGCLVSSNLWGFTHAGDPDVPTPKIPGPTNPVWVALLEPHRTHEPQRDRQEHPGPQEARAEGPPPMLGTKDCVG